MPSSIFSFKNALAIFGAQMLLSLNAATAAPAWPYAQSLEAVQAAPKNHKVRYEDAHVRFLEVVIRPGEKENMHGHQYPSVFVYDNDVLGMKGSNVFAKADDPMNNDRFKKAGSAPAPQGAQFPTCKTLAPEAPHAVTNTDSYLQHFYRLEFKRIDGDDIKTNWQTWYPWMLQPLKPVKDLVPGPALGKPLSKEWPYPLAYESVKAAPNNHYLRYENDRIRLIEVVIRPGETENMHGHQYPSVFAYDSSLGAGGNAFLNPSDPLNNDGTKGGQAPPPVGALYPTCRTLGPEAPHAAHNDDTYPVHFYRIEFKRIDGEGIKTHWKQWYPWMGGK
jgi:hypothetical protein